MPKKGTSFAGKARSKCILKKIMKTRNNTESNTKITGLVESLPSDVIAEVVSRVASSSVTDLFSCKLSCKTLEEIGKEKYVIRQVDIEDFNTWRLNSRQEDAALAYSKLCADNENPGALFLQGMGEYFREVKVEQGMKTLERAANLGHKTAAYVLGLILVCCASGNDKDKGVELLKSVKACSGKKIVDYRIRLRNFIHRIWWPHELGRQYKPIFFDKDHNQCRRNNQWKVDSYYEEDDDDAHFCEACTCEFESKFFCWLFSS